MSPFCAIRLSIAARCCSLSASLTLTFAFAAAWRKSSLRIWRSSQVAVKLELTAPSVVLAEVAKTCLILLW